MKKLGVMLAVVLALFIVPCLAQARLVIPLPPPIPFLAPPPMIVLPETEVYVAPDYDQDLYFYQGYWWRPWGGRWYRSLRYDSGWEFYNGVPGWYGGVYPHWRENYRHHVWGGHRWDYHPLHYDDVRTHWRTWHETGHHREIWGTTGSYRHMAETRRDFRGFAHEPPGGTRHSFDLSKNRNAFAGMERGSNVRMQSSRGLQSRQSMSSKGVGGVSKGKVDRRR
jgi:hypothetical protein